MENTTIDSEYYVEAINRPLSFRNVVRLINTELLKTPIEWKGALFSEQRYKQLREIGCSYPVEYLLFDFCIAALEGDHVDAGLYLAHSLHILGLNKSLNLLLSVIINEQLTKDPDIRQLLLLLARRTEPRNASTYVNSYHAGYTNRYEIYREELRKLTLQ